VVYEHCVQQGWVLDGTVSQAGIKGQKGEEGEASTVAGPKGQKGVDGTAGAKGEPGTNGDKGQKGLDGDGTKGQKGQAGTAAAKGDAGPKGQKGELGTGGAKGEPGTNGDKGQKGDDGTAGTNGDKGQKGATGSAGSAAGADTQVQFNNSNAFAGDAGLTFNSGTDTLTVASQPTISDGLVAVRTGSGSAGAIDLFCEVSNLHRTRIQSGPHAGYTGGNVTLTLPTIAPPNDGDILQGTTAGVLSWVTPGGGTGLQARTTANATTASLANDASGNIDITTNAPSLLLQRIETDQAAWIRVYTSDQARTDDAARVITDDPAPGSGVLAEIVTTGAGTQAMTPGTVCYFDADAAGTRSNDAFVAVQNLSGGTTTIQVTLTFVALEAQV